MGYRLGLDLGATRTVAVVCRAEPDGLPEFTVYALSSVLSLNADGAMVPGGAGDPAREARGFTGRVGIPGPLLVAGRSWAAETLCAVLVRRLVDRVAEREGGQPEGIALSAPPSWSRHTVSLLEAALEGFGLAVAFVSTPHAVVLTGGHPDGPLAVLDLGESHCTAAVVDAAGDVLAAERAGAAGAELDRLLAQRLVPAADPDLDPAVVRACAVAKVRLSTEPAVEIGYPPPRHDALWVDRRTFEALARPLVDAAAALLARVVDASGVSVTEVLLVGGSARIPLVAAVVAEAIGCPVRLHPDPEHAAATGAVLAILPGRAEAGGDPARDGDRGTAAHILAAGATAANADAVTSIAAGPAPPAPAAVTPPWDGDDLPAVPPSAEPAPYVAPVVTSLSGADPAWEYGDGSGARRRRTGVLIGASALLVVLGLTGIVAAWPRERPLGTGSEADLGSTSSTAVPTTTPTATSPVAVSEPAPADGGPAGTSGGRTSFDGATNVTPRAGTTSPVPGAGRADRNPPAGGTPNPGAQNSGPQGSGAPIPGPQDRDPDAGTPGQIAQNPPAQNPPAQNPPAQNPPAQNPPGQAPPAQAPPAQAPPAQNPSAQAPPAQAPPAQNPPAQNTQAPARNPAPGSAGRAPSGGAPSTDGSRVATPVRAASPPPSSGAPGP
ncbi:MAG: Hsp70 family protein [Pseudonocardia sp.]|nr:Hsp70 family protein [Pseudonocardia sp.]